ncbi:MAG: molecular chaperone Hsp90 [Oscillospiraceae bacterium]|nr:molecular chaperone Hsp90 [Oscillospiraceae bacterium]MDD4368713.1 molecular chaperone Hsp90 [Oscillospiraceae bacterium]
MTNELISFVTDKTKKLIAAPSVCPESKAAAKAWLAAVGTDDEAETTRHYIKELEEDITPIDDLIAFAASEDGLKVFGTEAARNLLMHAKEIRVNGARFCDCPACAAAEAILSKKTELLAY